MRHLPTMLCVLLLSSAVAAVVNKTRATPMPWLREPRAVVPKSDPVPVNPSPQKPGPSSQPVSPTPPPAPTSTTMTADIVLTHLKNRTAHLVDAREDHEWVDGHLRGAIHIPASAIYDNISRILQQVPPTEKVIVYCGGGQCEASHHVADALSNDFHFTDVSIYTKGWEEIEKVEG